VTLSIEWIPEGHEGQEEWVGYPIRICAECQVAWPCDVVVDANEECPHGRARGICGECAIEAAT